MNWLGLLFVCALSISCDVADLLPFVGELELSEQVYFEHCYNGYGGGPGSQDDEVADFMDTYCITNNGHELCTETYLWMPQFIESVCKCTWENGYVEYTADFYQESISWYVSSSNLSSCSQEFGLPGGFVWEPYTYEYY